MIGLLNPITGVIAGALLAHERLSAPQLLGITVVFSGIILGQLTPAGRKSPRPAQEPVPATGAAGNPCPGSETRRSAHHASS